MTTPKTALEQAEEYYTAQYGISEHLHKEDVIEDFLAGYQAAELLNSENDDELALKESMIAGLITDKERLDRENYDERCKAQSYKNKTEELEASLENAWTKQDKLESQFTETKRLLGLAVEQNSKAFYIAETALKADEAYGCECGADNGHMTGYEDVICYYHQIRKTLSTIKAGG